MEPNSFVNPRSWSRQQRCHENSSSQAILQTEHSTPQTSQNEKHTLSSVYSGHELQITCRKYHVNV